MNYRIIDDDFIKNNNARLLSYFEIQPSYKPEPTEPKKESKEKIDRANDMLLDIYNRFDVASSRRADDLSLSAEASNRIYKYIEKALIVEAIHFNLTGKKGGLSKFHVLTDKGLALINKPAIKEYSGGKGAKHIFVQRYFKKHLPATGFKEIVIEKDLCGKRIDLFGKYQELRIAIEICISTIQTEYLNVLKDLDKCDFIFIACTDKKTKQKLEKTIYKQIPVNHKVRICVVHELLNVSYVSELLNNKSCELFNTNRYLNINLL